METTQKTIDTLLEDINSLFLSGVDNVSDSVYEAFGQRMAAYLKSKVESFGKKREFSLRMSAIGKPDTQLYFDSKGYAKEELEGHHYLKFMYGDITEEVLLTLAEVAGHKVERRQEEVSLNGVSGHIDAIIDNDLVDVKSASTYSFERFKEGTVKDSDSFGYIYQISGYAQALGKTRGFFWAFDKTLGHMCLMKVDKTEMYDASARIDHLRKMLECSTPPIPKCSIKQDKNGNEYLGTPCSYCPHKSRCNPGLRTFIYSTGPKFFTKVVSEPRVAEVTVPLEE